MGQLLVEMRKERHWSNADIAQCAGIAPSHVSRLIHGHTLPTVKYAIWLADCLQGNTLDFVQAALQDTVWSFHLEYTVKVVDLADASEQPEQVVVQQASEAAPVLPAVQLTPTAAPVSCPPST